jgi:hypothetical protein
MTAVLLLVLPELTASINRLGNLGALFGHPVQWGGSGQAVFEVGPKAMARSYLF